eukprot:4406917-Pleurochrysis_carterae.AAC.2
MQGTAASYSLRTQRFSGVYTSDATKTNHNHALSITPSITIPTCHKSCSQGFRFRPSPASTLAYEREPCQSLLHSRHASMHSQCTTSRTNQRGSDRACRVRPRCARFSVMMVKVQARPSFLCECSCACSSDMCKV